MPDRRPGPDPEARLRRSWSGHPVKVKTRWQFNAFVTQEGAKAKVLVLVAAALALTGCGTAAVTSAHPPLPSGTASTQPANPVTIVRDTGATVTPGEQYGSRDVYGNLSAGGNFYGPGCTAADNCSEQVTVYSLKPGQTAAQAMAQSGLVSSDNQVVITTRTAIVCVTPVDVLDGGGLSFLVPPPVIAVRVHGTVLVPAS